MVMLKGGIYDISDLIVHRDISYTLGGFRLGKAYIEPCAALIPLTQYSAKASAAPRLVLNVPIETCLGTMQSLTT